MILEPYPRANASGSNSHSLTALVLTAPRLANQHQTHRLFASLIAGKMPALPVALNFLKGTLKNESRNQVSQKICPALNINFEPRTSNLELLQSSYRSLTGAISRKSSVIRCVYS